MGKTSEFACIRCHVDSCAFHAGEEETCELNAIQVEPCANCESGKAEDESCCGSYRRR